MPETKVVRSTSEQPVRDWPESGLFGSRSLFGPMIPFGDLFGVNPFALMREFTKDMDRALSMAWDEGAPQVWRPAIEVKKVDNDIVVTAELPGIKTEDIKVEVTDEVLT